MCFEAINEVLGLCPDCNCKFHIVIAIASQSSVGVIYLFIFYLFIFGSGSVCLFGLPFVWNVIIRS